MPISYVIYCINLQCNIGKTLQWPPKVFLKQIHVVFSVQCEWSTHTRTHTYKQGAAGVIS